jgi:predicted secreted protein
MKSDPAVPARTSQPLAFRDPGIPIKVSPDEEFSIILVSNPSTGFLWKMTLPEGQRTIKFLGSEHVISREVMPGVPGDDVYRFKAMTPGETKADFIYKRPWETKTAPERKIFTIFVQED